MHKLNYTATTRYADLFNTMEGVMASLADAMHGVYPDNSLEPRGQDAIEAARELRKLATAMYAEVVHLDSLTTQDAGQQADDAWDEWVANSEAV